MAITFIQSSNNHFTGTSSILSMSASGSGNLIAIMFFGGIDISTVTSITDNVGNMYQEVPNTRADEFFAGFVDIWYAKNSIAGATTLTVTFGGASADGSALVMEYSGVDHVNAIDDGQNAIVAGGNPTKSPVLTVTDGGDLLLAVVNKDSVVPTGVTAPWSVVSGSTSPSFVNLINPGATGTYQAIYTPVQSDGYITAGAAFLPTSSVLTLSLSDSVSSSDSLIDSFGLPMSDSVSSSDSAPQSFSIQSDFISPVSTPIVESLVNQLVPATVKTYFVIEE